MATIEDLLLEKDLLVTIFSHYIRSEGHEAFSRNIPRVCKIWNDLSSTSSLWKIVRTGNWNYLLNVSQRGLLKHTKVLKADWDLNYDESYSDMNLSVVLKNITELKAFDFEGKTVSGNAIMLLTEHCPHLERLHLKTWAPINNTHEWNQFFTVCGPTLKDLDLSFYDTEEEAEEQQLLSSIASRCPQLERLNFLLDNAPFSIEELRSGCPRLKELRFSDCCVIPAGMNDFLCCGFKELKTFGAAAVDFSGVDVYNLLKDSVDLEFLALLGNDGLVLSNISKIPSNNVRSLMISPKDPNQDVKALEDAVWKWRRTLYFLYIRGWQCNISCVLERLMKDNPNPQLKSLVIDDNIDLRFFEKLIQKCQNLIYLEIGSKNYKSREEIKEALEFLMKAGHDS